jgi:hypothetical protein
LWLARLIRSTDLVVHQHDGGQDGVRAQRVLELVQVQQAIFFDVEVGHLEALALQFAHGVEHGLVLGLHRDQVLAPRAVEVRGALDGEVDAFGGAAGPDDFTRVGVHQTGHLGAGFFDGLFGLPAPGVAARGGVAEVFAQPGDHGVHHPGVAGRCGAVIQVDGEVRGHVGHGFRASTGVTTGDAGHTAKQIAGWRRSAGITW